MKAKKVFGRLLVILMIVCMFTQTVGAVSFEKESDNTVYIIVDERVDAEKAQLIIDAVSGKEIITKRSNCTSGHSLARTTVKEIICRQYSTAPRCLENTYDVIYCTRSGCNYIDYSLRGSSRIYHCL